MNVDEDNKAAGARSRHNSRTSTHCHCAPPRYVPEVDAEQKRTLEEIIPVDSVGAIAKHLLECEHFFRLTIDLKKLKFVQPLLSRVEQDDDFVGSVSLSYLTAPLFQSSDVFHAVQVSRNPKDPGELLISDGFCSFRFEDRLHWSDFTRLFLPQRPAIEGSTPSAASVSVNDAGGATLPIFVRARQCPTERKSTTIGVATLTFESFLSPEPPDVSQIPQTFYTNLISFEPPPRGGGGGDLSMNQPPASTTAGEEKEGTCEGPSLRELPIFEGLTRVPIITRESATIVGVLTLGVAIDLMLSAAELGALLSKALHRVTPIHPLRSCNKGGSPPGQSGEEVDPTDSVTTDGADFVQSTPSTLQRKRRNGGHSTTNVSAAGVAGCKGGFEPDSTPSHGGRSRCFANGRRLNAVQSGVPGLPPARRQTPASDSVHTSSFSFGMNPQTRMPSAIHTAGAAARLPSRKQRTRGLNLDSCSSSAPSDEDAASGFLRRAVSSFRQCGGGGTPTAMAAMGSEQLLQCEMMLMKLAAEQQHNKFREEMRAVERKAEERLNDVKAENQKLRNENQSLERKLLDLDKKLQELQKALGSTSPRKRCAHTGDISRQVDRSISCDPNRDETIEELRRQNERLLQLLLRQQRTPAGGGGGYAAPQSYNDPFVTDPPDTYGLERHVGLTRAATAMALQQPLTHQDAYPTTLFDQPVWQSYHRQQHLWGAPGEMPRTGTARTGRPLPPLYNAATNPSRPPPVQRQGRLPIVSKRAPVTSKAEAHLARDHKGVRSISPGELRTGNENESGRIGRSRKSQEELVSRKTAQVECSRRRHPLTLSDSSPTSEKANKRKSRGRKSNSASSIGSSPLSSRSRQLINKHFKESSD